MIRDATLLQAFARKFPIHWNRKLGMDWQPFTGAVPNMTPFQYDPYLFDTAEELAKAKAQL